MSVVLVAHFLGHYQRFFLPLVGKRIGAGTIENLKKDARALYRPAEVIMEASAGR